ncbi:MAG TPA: hypothetical protein VGO27_06060 [Candidatus Acidoferrum sp.]|nr:hypothetical protein [Candidatus Acidoferrum sp.]
MKLIDAALTPYHRTSLMTFPPFGARNAGLTHLKVGEFDSNRTVIHYLGGSPLHSDGGQPIRKHLGTRISQILSERISKLDAHTFCAAASPPNGSKQSRICAPFRSVRHRDLQ